VHKSEIEKLNENIFFSAKRNVRCIHENAQTQFNAEKSSYREQAINP
jgi:hypothetical protein